MLIVTSAAGIKAAPIPRAMEDAATPAPGPALGFIPEVAEGIGER
ncbi:MAG TPA: hypothetical protein PLX06_15665 [Fimbriimonadaceae bacterium]|nr:hypothetical protein [Fimbriimonadaceae bacterium]